jgi:hypothetical protein
MDASTHGGCAKRIPRNLSYPFCATPVKTPSSNFTVGDKLLSSSRTLCLDGSKNETATIIRITMYVRARTGRRVVGDSDGTPRSTFFSFMIGCARLVSWSQRISRKTGNSGDAQVLGIEAGEAFIPFPVSDH